MAGLAHLVDLFVGRLFDLQGRIPLGFLRNHGIRNIVNDRVGVRKVLIGEMLLRIFRNTLHLGGVINTGITFPGHLDGKGNGFLLAGSQLFYQELHVKVVSDFKGLSAFYILGKVRDPVTDQDVLCCLISRVLYGDVVFDLIPGMNGRPVFRITGFDGFHIRCSGNGGIILGCKGRTVYHGDKGVGHLFPNRGILGEGHVVGQGIGFPRFDVTACLYEEVGLLCCDLAFLCNVFTGWVDHPDGICQDLHIVHFHGVLKGQVPSDDLLIRIGGGQRVVGGLILLIDCLVGSLPANDRRPWNLHAMVGLYRIGIIRFGFCHVDNALSPQVFGFKENIIDHREGLSLGKILSGLDDIAMLRFTDLYILCDILPVRVKEGNIADLCSCGTEGILDDHISCGGIVGHLGDNDLVFAGFPNLVLGLVGSLSDLQFRLFVLDLHILGGMDFGCVGAVGQGRIGDVFADGRYLGSRLIGHQDHIGILHVLPGLHGKAVRLFGHGDRHILRDVIPVEGHFEAVLIDEEIILCGKLVLDDHVFGRHRIPLLGHTDGVCGGLPIVIDLFVRMLFDMRIGRVRGHLLIIGHLQGFIGNGCGDVVDLPAGKILIGYHHLILDDHLCFCRNRATRVFLSFRIPGFQDFRCLFPVEVIAVMLLVFDQMLLCL